MFGLSAVHIAVVVIVAVVLLKKTPVSDFMKDLGGGIKALREGLRESHEVAQEVSKDLTKLPRND